MIFAKKNSKIHNTIKSDNVKAVESLLKNGYDAGIKNDDGFNCLHMAVINNSYDMVELLSRDEKFVNSVYMDTRPSNVTCVRYTMYNGYTPLHFAVESKNEKMVELLVSRNADLNATSVNYGRSPLHTAVLTKHTPIIEILLKAGANANGYTHPTFDHLNLSVEKSNTPLHLAVLQNNKDNINLLLKFGADVSSLNGDGDTPFHLACGFSDCTRVIELVLDNNHLCCASSEHIQMALNNACMIGNVPILDFLRNKSCDDHSVDQASRNRTLQLYSTNGNLAVMDILMKAGANIDHKNGTNGKTPLYMAFETGSTVMRQYLMMLGCDIFVKSFYNNTLLHLVAKVNDCFRCELLLFAGLDPMSVNNGNETPFQVACRFNNTKIISILLDNGININKIPDDTFRFFFVKADPEGIKIVLDHIMKIKALGCFIAESHLNLLDSSELAVRYDFKEGYERCVNEVRFMRKLKIGKTFLTYYDICKKSINQLTLSLNNREVLKMMVKCKEVSLPMFGKMVEYKLKKAYVRKTLQDKCKQYFEDGRLNSTMLPECSELILNMLDNKDLDAVISAVTGGKGILFNKEGIAIGEVEL